ncbi:penicillin-binding transpeptidase domain-containing protein, partial [Pseudomonas aeruginosa]
DAQPFLGQVLVAVVLAQLALDQVEAAMVVTNPETGEIQALIGSRDPRFAGFNRALDAVRPIGSLIKPAVYLTALERPSKYTL